MFNKVYLIGNLGRDPELRSTDSGNKVARLSLATDRRWKDGDGKRQEKTEWHQVVVFGRQAEIAAQYLARGRLLFVEGRLQTQSWVDQTSGEQRFRTEVVCENFQMIDPSPGASAASVARAADAGEASGG